MASSNKTSKKVLLFLLVLTIGLTEGFKFSHYFKYYQKCRIVRKAFPVKNGFIATVRCQCFGGKTIVDSILRTPKRRIAVKLIKCAGRNLAEIEKLCVVKEQSLFPVRVLSAAEKCCKESGGTLTGDMCA